MRTNSWSNLNHGRCPLCNSEVPACLVCWGKPITKDNLQDVKKQYKLYVRHKDVR